MILVFQLLLNAIASGAIVAIGALGLGLNRRATGTWNMAFGALIITSGLVARDVVMAAMLSPWWLPVIASVIGGIVSFIVWCPFARLFPNSEGGQRETLVASIGIAIIMDNLLALRYGTENQYATHGTLGVSGIGGVTVSAVQIMILVLALVISGCLFVTRKALIFRVIQALDTDAELVEISGWSAESVRARAVLLAGALGGLAGGLTMLDTGMDAFGGMAITLVLLTAVLLGGARLMPGWVFGAFMVAIVKGVTSLCFATKWAEMSTFIILVVVLIARGDGLVRVRRRLAET